MTSQSPKEVLVLERLKTAQKGGLSPSQVEILHLTHRKLVDASEYFSNGNLGHFKVEIAPTIIDNFGKIEKEAGNKIPLADYKKVSESGSLAEVVSYSYKEGFDRNQTADVLMGVLGERFTRISALKDREISIAPDNNFSLLKPDEKLRNIMDECKKFKLDFVDNFYRKYPTYLEKIRDTTNVDTLTLIRLKFEKDLKDTPEDRYVRDRLTAITEAKIKGFKDAAQAKLKFKEVQSRKEKSEEYYRALESALSYLRYCYPNEEIGKLATVAEVAIKQIAKARDRLSEVTDLFAASHQLAELFWPIRLGRKITDPGSLGLNKNTIERFSSTIFDNRLRTESAAFWFEKQTKLMPSYELYPNLVLVRSIESLLSSHAKLYGSGKGDQPVKIMILVNDNTSLKLTLSSKSTYHEIVSALQKTPFKNADLSLKQKYVLKKESYKPKRRSKEYREFYEHKEKRKLKFLGREFKLPVEKQVEGDYVVRLTTHSRKYTESKNSPYSLFSVDSHKALVDIDLNHGRGIDISMKLAHRHFDGRMAKPFFTNFYSLLESSHERDMREQMTQPRLEVISQAKPIKQDDRVISNAPLFEANTSVRYDGNYTKFKMTGAEKQTISPNVIRAATLSLANGADDAHVLVAANTPAHTDGPHDNVQPVIVSLHPIKRLYNAYKLAEAQGREIVFKREEVFEVLNWISKTNEAVEYAKKGLSAPAVLAAPTGHAEKIVYEVSKPLHRGVTLLKESSGMFSPLPDLSAKSEFDDIIFYTAVGDTYGKKADLQKPHANTGTIGYSQSMKESGGRQETQAFYSIRKTPQQAQTAFSKFVTDELLAHDKKREVKERKALKALNSLIVDWESMILGKTSLEDYDESLLYAFNQLSKDSVCGYKNLESMGITNYQSLQGRLNLVLSRDARETIDVKKLEKEKALLYGFLTAINRQP